MHRFVVGFILLCFALANSNPIAAKSFMDCNNLKVCERQLTKHLENFSWEQQGRYPKISHFAVANSFEKFGDQGWNALFGHMEHSKGDAREYGLAALSYLGESRTTPLTQKQWAVVRAMWGKEPNFSLGEIISHDDTPKAHALLIDTLSHPNEIIQSIALAVGVGRDGTPISPQHLPDIIALLGKKPQPEYIELLARIASPIADVVLWNQIESDNPQIFKTAYKILKAKSAPRLMDVFMTQINNYTPENKVRVLMIADQLWYDPLLYRKQISTDRILFYEKWFENPNVSETSKLVPFIVLRRMYQYANGRLSKREGEMPYVKQLEEILFSDGDEFRHFFFQSLEATIDTRFQYSQLIDTVYDTALLNIWFPPQEFMSAPKKWIQKMRGYLMDERVLDDTHFFDFLMTYDDDVSYLKSLILPRLEKDSSWRVLTYTMMAIAESKVLRQDLDIRVKINKLRREHPFTIVRAAATIVLSKKEITSDIIIGYTSGFLWRIDEVFIEVNKARPYCLPRNNSATPEWGTLPEFPEFGLGAAYNLGIGYDVRDAKRTSQGWLIGYNGGEFGGGFVYYPDKAKRGIILRSQTPNNVIRIIEGTNKDEYWVLTGLRHMMGSESRLHKVTIRGNTAITKITKRIPFTPYNVSVTENGDLFMDYRASSYTTLDTKRSKPKPNSQYKYDPPLLFTKEGVLKSACAKNPPEY